ncbi:hypothetical protein [Planococcus lenghuensis]|uniref:Uncharacterized protein n=1 Tax=Planococcus lenghuensis TaxID=2213202 RepID=A0A1Q2L4I5_9BACL|nr:hypothetical protein [Planococcus lenghuensis]AQQ55368.1 hypothetical protein B0X71_19550 [Planococcus lenghuensis]
MSNEEMIQEYRALKKEAKAASEAEDWDTREQLLDRTTELAYAIDWGFRVGDVVERRAKKRWVRDTILKIEGVTYTFKTIIVPIDFVRSATEKHEQLTLL